MQWALANRVIIHFFVFVCAGIIFGLVNQFLLDPFAGLAANFETFARNSAPLMVALVCLMPIFVRDTLKMSNRIAGPMHNLQTTVKRIADGEEDVPPLRFRKGDMWNDLPDQFNRMINSLRNPESRATPKQTSEQNTSEKEPVCV